jgi:DNA-binding NtrC family response regulator
MIKQEPRILIVDDDVGVARTTAMILEHQGYCVSTAEDGAEALAAVDQRPFDVILLDIKMPVMDGIETHRRIKEIRPDTTVVMMTAYAVEDLVEQALEDGAYGILYKPLDMEEVVSLIEELREAKRGALILVVDDNPAICTTMKHVLQTRDCEVRIAHTGEDAIAAARERAYDVIFVDMKLPTINGLETYLAIRELDSQVVGIVMTGFRREMEELVEEALCNQAYACLFKPFDVEELLRLVDGICVRKRRKGGGS